MYASSASFLFYCVYDWSALLSVGLSIQMSGPCSLLMGVLYFLRLILTKKVVNLYCQHLKGADET